MCRSGCELRARLAQLAGVRCMHGEMGWGLRVRARACRVTMERQAVCRLLHKSAETLCLLCWKSAAACR
jgi:hypothetical protein